MNDLLTVELLWRKKKTRDKFVSFKGLTASKSVSLFDADILFSFFVNSFCCPHPSSDSKPTFTHIQQHLLPLCRHWPRTSTIVPIR